MKAPSPSVAEILFWTFCAFLLLFAAISISQPLAFIPMFACIAIIAACYQHMRKDRS